MRTFIVIAIASFTLLAAAGCTAIEDPAGSQAAVRACPYLVPYCPPECNLVGHCPQQCQCSNGSGGHVTLCGTEHCTGTQICCSPPVVSVDGGTSGYQCYDSTYGCPL